MPYITPASELTMAAHGELLRSTLDLGREVRTEFRGLRQRESALISKSNRLGNGQHDLRVCLPVHVYACRLPALGLFARRCHRALYKGLMPCDTSTRTRTRL